MAETGVLRPDARVELLDGQIIDMSPIGPFHGGVTKRLNRFFTNLGKGQWLVAVQDPVQLDEHSEPEPDLMLLKPAGDDYTTRHPAPEDVYLLIEDGRRNSQGARVDRDGDFEVQSERRPRVDPQVGYHHRNGFCKR